MRLKAIMVLIMIGIIALLPSSYSAAFADEAGSGVELYSTDDFRVDFSGAEVVESSRSADSILALYYDFTNMSPESQTFVYLFSINAYQNGVECEQAYSWDFDDASEDAYNALTAIKDGATVRVARYFILKDTDTPVEVEFSRLLALDSDVVYTTIGLPDCDIVSINRNQTGRQMISVEFTTDELSELTAEALRSGKTIAQYVHDITMESIDAGN